MVAIYPISLFFILNHAHKLIFKGCKMTLCLLFVLNTFECDVLNRERTHAVEDFKGF